MLLVCLLCLRFATQLLVLGWWWPANDTLARVLVKVKHKLLLLLRQ